MKLKLVRKEIRTVVLNEERSKIRRGPYYIHAHDEIDDHPEMIRLAGIWFQCFSDIHDEIKAQMLFRSS